MMKMMIQEEMIQTMHKFENKYERPEIFPVFFYFKIK